MAIVTALETTPGTRRRLGLANPATLEPIGEIEVADAQDARAAVERARKAQQDWSALPIAERSRFMIRGLEALLARQDEIIETVMRETGKPKTEALQMEVYAVCDAMNFYAKHAGKILKPQSRRLHGLLRFMKKLRIVYRPLGVVGVISPWNWALCARHESDDSSPDGGQCRDPQTLRGHSFFGAAGRRNFFRCGASRRTLSSAEWGW